VTEAQHVVLVGAASLYWRHNRRRSADADDRRYRRRHSARCGFAELGEVRINGEIVPRGLLAPGVTGCRIRSG